MNIQTFRQLNRRTLLRGAGTCLALPWLEAMMPREARAASTPDVAPRMGMFYFGTGMNMRQFYPDGFGIDAGMFGDEKITSKITMIRSNSKGIMNVVRY